jgi:hypothetical protein
LIEIITELAIELGSAGGISGSTDRYSMRAKPLKSRSQPEGRFPIVFGHCGSNFCELGIRLHMKSWATAHAAYRVRDARLFGRALRALNRNTVTVPIFQGFSVRDESALRFERGISHRFRLIIFFAQFVPVLRTLGGPFAGANLMVRLLGYPILPQTGP